MVYIPMNYYSAVRKKDSLTFLTTCKDPEHSLISEDKSDRERPILYDINFICEI